MGQAGRRQNNTLAAAGMVGLYALIIGFTDNLVRAVAGDLGLWQFHILRSAMVTALFLLAAVPLRLHLAPRNFGAVAARSVLTAGALMIYFGCIAFLPVAQVAAGLFAAPIFVLLIGRFAYGHPLTPTLILAVAVGFAGVLLVLSPSAGQMPGVTGLLPLVAGALYATGNIATREWCEGESSACLTLGFFVALMVGGTAGLAALAALDPPVAEGAAGFIARGWVTPPMAAWPLLFVQALGALLGVALATRAYQVAEASRVSVLEYIALPAAAMWGYILWGEALGPAAVVGMALIFLAGVLIARSAR